MKHFLSYSITKLLTSGYLRKLKEKWWYKEDCSHIEFFEDVLSFNELGAVFAIIMTGIMICIFIIIVEYYWYKRK